jgi:hypothetical protein
MMLIRGIVLSTVMVAMPQPYIHAAETVTETQIDRVAEEAVKPNESPEFRKYKASGGKVYQGYPEEIAAETKRKCVRDTKVEPWNGGNAGRWMRCLPLRD